MFTKSLAALVALLVVIVVLSFTPSAASEDGGSTQAVGPSPVVGPPSCKTVPPTTFNRALKVRVSLGGAKPKRWAHEPVCVRPDYRKLQAQIKRLRRQCQNRNGTIAQNLCWIRQAARRWHQPLGDMVRVAWCESTMGTNVGSTHVGLFQFLRSTFATTPYAAHDPTNPKWNALAAAWMWEHGRRSEWQCQ